MAIISLQEGIRKAQENEFWALRGKAVQAYASLEQVLCRIFAHISGTTDEVAAIIFFKITSYDVRNKILEKLFTRKFGTEFNLFRNSLLVQLRAISLVRNEIVHWNAVNNITSNDAGETVAVVTMKPQTSWPFDPTTPSKGNDDLVRFIEKCGFYIALCNMFYFSLTERFKNTTPPDVQKTWLDIFAQPIVYPPPEDHPLSQMQQEPSTPPESCVVIS